MNFDEKLYENKQKISKKYLGKYGIHGVGIGKNCIYLYCENQLSSEIMFMIESEIDSPYKLDIYLCGKPKLVNLHFLL